MSVPGAVGASAAADSRSSSLKGQHYTKLGSKKAKERGGNSAELAIAGSSDYNTLGIFFTPRCLPLAVRAVQTKAKAKLLLDVCMYVV